MGPLVKLGRDFTRPGPLKGSFLEGKSLAIFRKSRLVKYHNFVLFQRYFIIFFPCSDCEKKIYAGSPSRPNFAHW